MQLQDLNPHIMCVLCGGYLVDATTIVECLHSFCRSCIVKYLQTSYHCPVCDVEVHKTKPLLHIRPDRPLQDIVNKLVPGLVYDELDRRSKFEDKSEEENSISAVDTALISETGAVKTDCETNSKSNAEVKMEDPMFVTLEYYRRQRIWNERQIFPTRYLRCPSAVTVNVLKKFLAMKFAIPNTHQAELVRSDELLDDSLTMKEVSQIYGLYSKSFLDLQYSFLDVCKEDTVTKVKEPPRKKLRICNEDGDETKESEHFGAVQTKQLTVDEKGKHPQQQDIRLDKDSPVHHSPEGAILLTFPETPPSFELDPGEEETSPQV